MQEFAFRLRGARPRPQPEVLSSRPTTSLSTSTNDRLNILKGLFFSDLIFLQHYDWNPHWMTF